jgi:hypothetical protein
MIVGFGDNLRLLIIKRFPGATHILADLRLMVIVFEALPDLLNSPARYLSYPTQSVSLGLLSVFDGLSNESCAGPVS